MPAICLLMACHLHAQDVIEMDENDIDLKILTWHYNRYDNAPTGSWKIIAHEGEAIYKVNFEFKGDIIETIYDDAGNIMSENKYWDIEKVPQPVTDLLDYRIVKYKLVSFLQETEFEKKKPTLTTYRVEVHTKTGGKVVYWFDDGYKVLPEKKDNLAYQY